MDLGHWYLRHVVPAGPARRSRLLLGGSVIALVAAAAMLVSWQGSGLHSASRTPAFIAHQLGAPSAVLPAVSRPHFRARSEVTPGGLRVRLGGTSVSLSSADGATGRWTSYAGGATRPTGFGQELVTVSGSGAEQLLQVERHQGKRTWSWRLDTSGLAASLRTDGMVAFRAADGRDTGLRITPVELLDVRGARVTPKGLRWSLARRGGAQFLELRLDDSSLPVPYLIDPSVQAGSVTFSGVDMTAGKVTTWTVGFTPTTTLVNGSTITATFPSSGTSAFTVPASPAVVLGAMFATANCGLGVVSKPLSTQVRIALTGASCSLANPTAATFTIAGITNAKLAATNASNYNVVTSLDTTALNPTPSVTITPDSFVKLALKLTGSSLVAPGTVSVTCLTGTPAAQIAGTPFGGGTVWAFDQYCNPVTTAPGDTVHLTSNDPLFVAPADLALAAGTAVFGSTSATLYTAGTLTRTLTANDVTDPAKTAGTSPVFTVSALAVSKLTITSAPATATAGTNFGNVVVKSTDTYGNPVVVNPATSFTLSASGSGTLSNNTGTIALNASIKTLSTVQYTKAESITLTATATGGMALAASAPSSTIAVGPGAASAATSTIAASPGSIAADGSSTSAITVQLKDALGNSLTGTGGAVTLSTTGGTLSAVTDNGNGTYSATLTAPSSAASGTVSGTVNAAAIVSTATVAFTAGAASGATSTVVAAPSTITANGSSTSAITVRLKDVVGGGLAAGGDIVGLSSTAGTLSVVTDNGNGTYSATLTAPTTAGSGTVSGTINGSAIVSTATVAFTAGAASAATSTIGAAPGSIAADGSSTSAITVRLKDAYGNSLTGSGGAVTLSTTGGTLSAVTDNGNGTYSATLTAPTIVGGGTVSGTVNGTAITSTAALTFSTAPASGATSTISAASGSLAADGASTTAIAIRLKNVLGVNIAVGGDTVVLSTTRGTLSAVTDNGDGTYSATLTAPSSAGSGTVSGTVNGSAITSTAVVTFTAGPASGATSTISAATATIWADGVATSAITVRLKDAAGAGLGVGGDTVVLSTTGGTLSAVTDNGNGTYSATLTAPSSAGSGIVSGTVNGAAITSTATVTFAAGPPGAASGTTSTIGASPSSIPPDGSSTSTITVRLVDVVGVGLIAGGDAVVLATTGGTLSAVTDNGNGTYTATLTSPLLAGSGTVSGTVNGTAIVSTATVAFAATPPPPAPAPTPVTCVRPLLVSSDGLSCLPPPPPPPPIKFVGSSPADGATLTGVESISLTANHIASWYAITVVGPDGATTVIPSGFGPTYSQPYVATGTGVYTLTATMDDGFNPAQQVTAHFTIVPTRPDVALPGKAGSVESADGGITVNWAADTFTEPVQVNVDDGGAVRSSFGLGSRVVRVTVTRLSDGTTLQAFAQPLELVFNAAGDGVPSVSDDGVNWTPLPALSSDTLPAGQADGYFRDASGAVHVLTRHLTFFGILGAQGPAAAELALTVTGTAVGRAGGARRIAVSLHITKRAIIRASLRSAAGKLIAVWTRPVPAGASTLNLSLPAGEVYRGACTIVLRATAGGQVTLRTVAVRLR